MRLIIIGSAKDVHIRLQSPYVSAYHAEILLLDNGDILITDKASKNGTFVNDLKLMPNNEVNIKRGDRIRVADVTLDWAKIPSLPFMQDVIEVRGIGTNFRNKHQLHGDKVSRFHATLKRKTNKKWYIQDHSLNGTKINGVPIPANTDIQLKRSDSIMCADQPVPNPYNWRGNTNTSSGRSALSAMPARQIVAWVVAVAVLVILMMLFAVKAKGQSLEWLVRPGIYSDIRYMGHDLFKARMRDGKYCVIRHDGTPIPALSADSITEFCEGRSLLLGKDGKRLLAVLDTEGNVVKRYDRSDYYVTSYPHYRSGMLAITDRATRMRGQPLYGYLNLEGEVAINPQFFYAAPFMDKVAAVQHTEGYFILINRSGHPALISDEKYIFLSSVVDGQLIGARKNGRKGGHTVKQLTYRDNRLKEGKTYESGDYLADFADDFTRLVTQNGHYYDIDPLWRVTGCYPERPLPYTIDDTPEIEVTDNMLSKVEEEGGEYIYYLGKPILEHAFDRVMASEKYAIVTNRNKLVGVLRLNPSAAIDIAEPEQSLVFYHNPTHRSVAMPDWHYVDVKVNVNAVKTDDVYWYLNNNGDLAPASLVDNGDGWILRLPYFMPDDQTGHTSDQELMVSFTYDGMDWMHRTISFSSQHQPGYTVSIEAPAESANPTATVNLVIKAVDTHYGAPTEIWVNGKQQGWFTGQETRVPITERLTKEGAQTFTYDVAVREDGCPEYRSKVSASVRYNPPKVQPAKPASKPDIFDSEENGQIL